MAKEDSKLVNRHKRMAMGDKIETMKTGGKVAKKSKPKKK